MRRKLTHQIQLLVHKLAKMLQIQCISNVCSLKKYHFISQDLRCNILIFLLLKRRRLKKFAPNKLQLISRINRASSFYMTLTSFLMVTRIKDNRNITSTLHVPKKCHFFLFFLHYHTTSNQVQLEIIDHKNYLPISQEYNRFYYNKLWDWIEWLKQILACHIKQSKHIESHCI